MNNIFEKQQQDLEDYDANDRRFVVRSKSNSAKSIMSIEKKIRFERVDSVKTPASNIKTPTTNTPEERFKGKQNLNHLNQKSNFASKSPSKLKIKQDLYKT